MNIRINLVDVCTQKCFLFEAILSLQRIHDVRVHTCRTPGCSSCPGRCSTRRGVCCRLLLRPMRIHSGSGARVDLGRLAGTPPPSRSQSGRPTAVRGPRTIEKRRKVDNLLVRAGLLFEKSKTANVSFDVPFLYYFCKGIEKIGQLQIPS